MIKIKAILEKRKYLKVLLSISNELSMVVVRLLIESGMIKMLALHKNCPASALSNKNMQIPSPSPAKIGKHKHEINAEKVNAFFTCYLIFLLLFSASADAKEEIIAIDSESTIVVGKKIKGYAIPIAIPKRDIACSLV